MNNSGDAAEQIARMSLEGIEFAVRITGTAAKETALFLITALKKSGDKGHLKLSGKERLKSMLKSGKPLEIYSIKERDLKRFVDGAKEYGIVYCVLRNSNKNPDGLCDIMVKADDAPKIARLAERFDFATVDKAKIKREILDSRAEGIKTGSAEIPQDSGKEAMDIADTEKLVNNLLGAEEGKAEPDAPEVDKAENTQPGKDKSGPAKTARETAETEVEDSRPLDTGSGRSRNQSGHTSEPNRSSVKGSTTRQSVKEEIREIRASRNREEESTPKRDSLADSKKSKDSVSTAHIQHEKNNRRKRTKKKGNR